MATKKVFKISDEEIVSLYLKGNSLSEIAKIAQDTKGLMALKKRLNDLGVSTKRTQERKLLYAERLSRAYKKYSLDETVFDCIDSKEKAYWLGWYMTDGHNNEVKHQVALRLQSSDEEILEKLKTFLKTTAPIYTYTRNSRACVELSVNSVHFSRALANLGVIQRKTHHKSVPNIDKKLLKSFILGYFDGDGCFSVTERNDRTETSLTYQLTFTGNVESLQEIERFIREQLDIKERAISKSRNQSYTLHYSGRKLCYKILNWLYEDEELYLKRKYDKYLKYRISAE